MARIPSVFIVDQDPDARFLTGRAVQEVEFAAVVNNVISLATVPAILAHGAENYQDYGVGRSRGTLPFQLAGNIRRGGLVEKAFGLTLRELIFDFGGGTASGRPVRAVQVGGPLGAYFPESLLDTPLDYEAFASVDGMVGHGGVVVFDDTVDMAEQARSTNSSTSWDFLCRSALAMPWTSSP